MIFAHCSNIQCNFFTFHIEVIYKYSIFAQYSKSEISTQLFHIHTISPQLYSFYHFLNTLAKPNNTFPIIIQTIILYLSVPKKISSTHGFLSYFPNTYTGATHGYDCTDNVICREGSSQRTVRLLCCCLT